MPPGTEHDGISNRKVTGSRPLPKETRRARERSMQAVISALQAPVQLQAVAKTADEQKLDYYSAVGAKASAVRALLRSSNASAALGLKTQDIEYEYSFRYAVPLTRETT